MGCQDMEFLKRNRTTYLGKGKKGAARAKVASLELLAAEEAHLLLVSIGLVAAALLKISRKLGVLFVLILNALDGR